MRAVLERMERAGHPPLHTLAPLQARAAYEAGAGVLEVPKAALHRVEDFSIRASDGTELAARLYAPGPQLLPVLLYFHGGGFTIGSVASHDVLCRELSRLSGCAVVSLDYRLAPEHRFPTAVHDAWDATRWLARHGASVGVDGRRLALGGDSAGGTLAAVCALMARDAGIAVTLQLLFYPGCGGRQDTPSHASFGQGLLLDRALIDYFFHQYIAAADRDDWRFAPLNVPDAEGVAPAWFGLAECDPLVDEGLLYTDKLRAAGVAVDLEIYRGVTHEFIKMGRAIPE
ncbi:MAG: alpha/beta hydrolase, partial [Haliea sp.]